MDQILTGTDVQEILEECWANGAAKKVIEKSGQYFELPSQLGDGYWHKMELRPGLKLSVQDLEKAQIHRHRIVQHSQQMPLMLTYYLSGGCHVDNDSFQMPEEELSGYSYLYCLPNTAELEEYHPGDRIKKIHISIDPQLIQGLCDRIYDLPNPLKQIVERSHREIFYYATPIIPAQRQILQQIFQCPYKGLTRHIYLEAKVLELLALHLDQILTSSENAGAVSSQDLEQIYQARDILQQDLVCPPSLPDLARKVNLNERKLKEGFRQAFDTTVFGYLTQRRMEKACGLLTRQHSSVAGVAAAVGYASATAFSSAFRRQIGLSPKRYQLSRRG
ncbi:MAG: AraC family transcriptional regulator [Cyanobacteria bacterium P01_D01_bin.73]